MFELTTGNYVNWYTLVYDESANIAKQRLRFRVS